MPENQSLPFGNLKENDDVVVYQIPKSQTNLIEYEQLDELKRDDPQFFACQHYIVDEETIRIFYRKESNYNKLSHYQNAKQELKKVIASNILKTENLLGTQYTTFFHPENIYINNQGDIKLAHRGIRSVLPPEELSLSQFVQDMKMIIVYLFTSYRFTELKTLDIDHLTENKSFIKQIVTASSIGELQAAINHFEIKETEIETPKKEKTANSVKQPMRKPKMSILSGLLIGLLVGMAVLYMFMVMPLTNTSTTLAEDRDNIKESVVEKDEELDEVKEELSTNKAILGAYRKLADGSTEEAIEQFEKVNELSQIDDQTLVAQYIKLNTVDSLMKAAERSEKVHVTIAESLVALDTKKANTALLELESDEPEVVIEQHWINKKISEVIDIYEAHSDNKRAQYLATLSYLEADEPKKALKLAKKLKDKDLQIESYEKEIELIEKDKSLDKEEKEEEVEKVEEKIEDVK